jgi:hypothetical protein
MFMDIKTEVMGAVIKLRSVHDHGIDDLLKNSVEDARNFDKEKLEKYAQEMIKFYLTSARIIAKNPGAVISSPENQRILSTASSTLMNSLEEFIQAVRTNRARDARKESEIMKAQIKILMEVLGL